MMDEDVSLSLIVKLSVRVASKENNSHIGQKLMADQLKATFQCVNHLNFTSLSECFNTSATIVGREEKNCSKVSFWT